MDVSVEGEEIGVLRSIPTSETSSSEQDRSQVVLRTRFNGDKTYDNRTEEIHRSWRTTYREGNYQFSGTNKLWGQRLEGVCNQSSCPHGGVGGGEVNWVQGRI